MWKRVVSSVSCGDAGSVDDGAPAARHHDSDVHAAAELHGDAAARLEPAVVGSVLYTAVGGTIRNYTVVVADDGTSAAQDYDIAVRPLPAVNAVERERDL
jgi:hypothetical protein